LQHLAILSRMDSRLEAGRQLSSGRYRGTSFWYKTEIKLDNGRRLTFDLTLPGALSTFDLSTLRIGCHGGVTGEDELFRARLYERIGAVTAAGGHVETAMKRLLLLLLLRSESGGFSLVDWTWTALHNALAEECGKPDPDARQKRLKRVLAWGEQKGIKKRRDNVVHAYWWNFDGVGVMRSRFQRRKNGVQMIGALEDLEEDAALIFEYARRLDELLGEDWPRAMLPAPSSRPGSQA
jgi:hypothetical protein